MGWWIPILLLNCISIDGNIFLIQKKITIGFSTLKKVISYGILNYSQKFMFMAENLKFMNVIEKKFDYITNSHKENLGVSIFIL